MPSAIIKGAFFRPPARGLLAALPQGTALVLRPEPGNAYDPFAVAVWVVLGEDDLAAMNEAVRARLAAELDGFGLDLGALAAQREWHLGYVPKERSAEVAGQLDSLAEWPARLGFAGGQPAAMWEMPSKESY